MLEVVLFCTAVSYLAGAVFLWLAVAGFTAWRKAAKADAERVRERSQADLQTLLRELRDVHARYRELALRMNSIRSVPSTAEEVK